MKPTTPEQIAKLLTNIDYNNGLIISDDTVPHPAPEPKSTPHYCAPCKSTQWHDKKDGKLICKKCGKHKTTVSKDQN
jgi:hypothetical protein